MVRTAPLHHHRRHPQFKLETKIEEEEHSQAPLVLELLFFGGLQRVVAFAGLVFIFLVTFAVAVVLIWSQVHFANSASGLGRVLGRGSTLATAWPGWVAALFFLIALFRLRSGDPEPPAGRKPISQVSVAELRSGLRAEYRAVRIAFLIVLILTLIELDRAVGICLETIRGTQWARDSVAITGVEAAGWLLAVLLLGAWAISFRHQLEQWGTV